MGEVDKAAGDDAAKEVAAEKKLQLDLWKVKRVEVGAQERAQRRDFDLRIALKGFVEPVDGDPDGQRSIVETGIEKAEGKFDADVLARRLRARRVVEFDARGDERNARVRRGNFDLGRAIGKACQSAKAFWRKC